MSNYEYLAARAHGMIGRLLPAERILSLGALDGIDDFIDELAATAGYDSDLAASAGEGPPLDVCERTLERHLARTVRRLWMEAEGEARVLVGILLSRHDLEEIKTILRRWRAHEPGAWRPLGAGVFETEFLRTLEALGSVQALAEAIGPTGPFGALVARVLRRHASVAPGELEDRLDAAWVEGALMQLEDGPNEVVRRVIGWEIDMRNILAILRGGGPRFLPGGWYISAARLEAAAGESEATSLAWMAGTPYAEALAVEDITAGSLRRIERGLERLTLRWHRGLARGSDPLGIAPISFLIAAKQAEVRNLRVIAAVLAHGLPSPVLKEELVVA